MSLRVAPNHRRQHSRAAVVVSKKVLKAAPKRNRVRRRIYETLREQWGHIKPAHDILVSVYDSRFLEMEHEELVAALKKGLQTAGIWTDKS